MSKIKPYKWDFDPNNVPCGNIGLHTDLCYTLLHIKHGAVAGPEMSASAMKIINDCQKPLLDIIAELEDEIETIYQDAAGADM